MKHLLLVLIGCLIISGCSQEPTELERCIEANVLPNNYEEKWSNHLEKIKDLNWDDNSDELLEIIKKYNNSRNRLELVSEACNGYSIENLVEQYPETEDMTVEEFDVWLNSEKGILFLEEDRRDCDEQALLAVEEDKERAKKLCHSQGIY